MPMIGVVLLPLLLSLAVAQGETTADPALAATDLEVRQVQLPNGLTILVREDHRSPLVATSVLYRVGMETPSLKGVLTWWNT